MAADTSTAILLPIGRPLGMDFGRSEPADDSQPGTAPRFRVQIGSRIARLTDEQFGAWFLAHGSAGDDAAPLTLQRLRGAMQREGVLDPKAPIGSLMAIGLLREVPADRVARLLFARTHRLHALMTGLGNSADRPASYALGLCDEPMVELSPETYRLVMRAGMYRSLLEAVIDLGDLAAAEERREPDPDGALAALFDRAHDLLSVNAAYFDTSARARIGVGDA